MAAKEAEVEDYMQEHYKRALEYYEIGVGDSDAYDLEEEAAILKDLTDEEKAKYEEMHEVLINELVELGRLTNLSSEIRQHMFKWMPGIPENYTARASKAVKQRKTPDEKGNVTVAISTAETEEQTEGEQKKLKILMKKKK